jgi:hypothetical protein
VAIAFHPPAADELLAFAFWRRVLRSHDSVEVPRACVGLVLEHPLDAIIIPQGFSGARQDVSLPRPLAQLERAVLTMEILAARDRRLAPVQDGPCVQRHRPVGPLPRGI